DAIALHQHRPHNIERDVLFELGDVETAFAAADLVREGVYNCAEVCQNQMEMHAAIADYDAVRDRMTVHASTQVPYYGAPDAGADTRHGHVADPRDQTACRRRLRLPHRGAERGAHRSTAGAQSRGLRAPRRQSRGDFHYPSGPAGNRYPAQNRHA